MALLAPAMPARGAGRHREPCSPVPHVNSGSRQVLVAAVLGPLLPNRDNSRHSGLSCMVQLQQPQEGRLRYRAAKKLVEASARSGGAGVPRPWSAPGPCSLVPVENTGASGRSSAFGGNSYGRVLRGHSGGPRPRPPAPPQKAALEGRPRLLAGTPGTLSSLWKEQDREGPMRGAPGSPSLSSHLLSGLTASSRAGRGVSKDGAPPE